MNAWDRASTAWLETIYLDTSVSYGEAVEAQLTRRNEIEAGRATNALFLCEHPPTITLGRNAQEDHLLYPREHLAELGVDVVDVDRGGDVTYHGPGQLVAYPILNLAEWRQSISWYLRTLEDVLIHLLSRYGLNGERLEGYTGVWVEGAKVAAIGVGIHNWVSYHGIALNVAPNMAHWAFIVPCGIADKPVTSLGRLLEHPPDMGEMFRGFEEEFRATFGKVRSACEPSKTT